MGVLVVSQKHGTEKRMRRELLQGTEESHHPVNSKLKSSVWQVEGDDDMLHEILKHLDAKSLASASCVSSRWRKAAEDESLWEGICTRNWPTAASRPQQLKSVVLALGGFRRLYALCLRPLLSRPYPPAQPLHFPRSSFLPVDKCAGGRQWSKDEVHLSLSLFSIDCYERLGRRSCSPSSLDFLCKASSAQIIEGLSASSEVEELPTRGDWSIGPACGLG